MLTITNYLRSSVLGGLARAVWDGFEIDLERLLRPVEGESEVGDSDFLVIIPPLPDFALTN